MVDDLFMMSVYVLYRAIDAAMKKCHEVRVNKFRSEG